MGKWIESSALNEASYAMTFLLLGLATNALTSCGTGTHNSC
jgi:hypothetical protein